MLSDRQVRKLRNQLSQGSSVVDAADAAHMSEKSAHKWKQGPLPSQVRDTRQRDWRTRPDPFAEVWESELVPLLRADERSELDGPALLRVLEEKYPGKYPNSKLRTLQRRVTDWRALHGPQKEVFFPQEHLPGREGAFDFTVCDELGVTIRGVFFAHLLFQFVLSYSKWRAVSLAFSETFEALVHGLQSALWTLGASPLVWRSDNLSAATHQLSGGGRELNRRFRAVIEHYAVESTRIEPGKSNQNGGVEKSHDILKTRLRQALVLRGSRDFESVDEYRGFVERVVTDLNRERHHRFEQERPLLKPLPDSRLPEYTTYQAQVRAWSTVHFTNRAYSVPSRLIGKEVEVRQHAEVIEIYYQGRLTETIPRLRGEKYHRIDYRHVIWSLVRKPGAFARYRYREELFPSLVFRRAYDSLVDARGERADVEYLRILHLAASTMETLVEKALCVLLEQGVRFDYADVKALAAPEKPTVPVLHIATPDPSEYNRLLACTGGG